MSVVRARMKSYIQPFERTLALQELRAMSLNEPKHLGLLEETSTEFELVTARSTSDIASRLAYWEKVESSNTSLITVQSLRESTVVTARNELTLGGMRKELPFRGEIPLPNRRCLRYGTHGIHEYRGKFFPQLVRSLINVSGIERGSLIGDPMSGSGTTLVEAVLAGCRARGLDVNPLSVLLAQVKCRLLSASPRQLTCSYEQVSAALQKSPKLQKRLPYLESLPAPDQEYLMRWFSLPVLSSLDCISQAVSKVSDEDCRNFMRIAISNILRRVSWQKDDDLRVRKEIKTDSNIDPKREFLAEIERSLRSVLAFLYQNGTIPNGRFRVDECDAKLSAARWGKASVDLIITSPPYATALPYLDTDRLSLCYLGLLTRSEHRRRDQLMIGNREISDKVRQAYWDRFSNAGTPLPATIRTLVDRIHRLNSRSNVGFRRRNLPALLSKYFFDMKDVMESMYQSLKKRRFAFVVVGSNHTIAGGQHVSIPTAQLLRDIASQVGFDVAESIPMEMLVSRDIFRKNATTSEEILTFYKAG